MANDQNNRIYNRVKLEEFAKIDIISSPVEAKPLDLSINGLRVQTEVPLVSGSEIDMFLFNKTLHVKAQVCWVRPAEDPSVHEVGLQLIYPDPDIINTLLAQLNKAPEDLHILILTAVELSAQSLGLYLNLTHLNLKTVLTTEQVLTTLAQGDWDLLVMDMSVAHATALLKKLATTPDYKMLPIIVLVEKIQHDIIELRSSHKFLEIFPEPVDVQELLLRAMVLMELAMRYAQVEKSRQHAEQQLHTVQQTLAAQGQEMTSMLTQVMSQSEAMGQLIQLQEALLGLQTFAEVIHFAQQWTLQNFQSSINLWYCENNTPLLLGNQPLDHPRLSLAERTQTIQELLSQRTKIVQDKVVLIRKGDVVLEVVSEITDSDLIDRLTFLMKVLAPVLLNKHQRLELQQAHQQLEQVLADEQAARARLNEELRAAAEVQDILIPKHLPSLASLEIASHYQSATDIGGDWFHVLELPKYHKVLIGIGDVTGHGPQAALVTSIVSGFFTDFKLRYASPTLARNNTHLPSPADVLADLNEILCDITQGKSLMTFHLSYFDPTTQQLSYASAAHNYPLLYRPSGWESHKMVKQLMAPGYRLGNIPDSHYTETTLEVAQGDYLVWYTDGLTECVSHTGEAYSLPRLFRLIAATPPAGSQALVDHIVQDINEFRGNTPMEDDLAFVVAKIL